MWESNNKQTSQQKHGAENTNAISHDQPDSGIILDEVYRDLSGDVRFLAAKKRTPMFFLDLHAIRQQLDEFEQLFPNTDVYYSTKTNPHPAIIRVVAARGLGFDVASVGEIKHVLRFGGDSSKLLFTHPVKSIAEIKQAYKQGVRKFTFDSLAELRRQYKYAPDAEHFMRLRPVSNASLYEYGKKFGAEKTEVAAIMKYAAVHDIPIHGMSFMIGSQSMSTRPWRDMFAYVSELLSKYYEQMPSLRVVNIGGGFPIEYTFEDVAPVEDIASAVADFVSKLPSDVRLIAEPGRFIAGRATVLATKVVQRISRGDQEWLYTDANAYSGLIEVIENRGHFPYRITSEHKGGKKREFMIAGKTLDPDDVLGKRVLLDDEISKGDILYIHDTGAYSSSFFTDYHALPKPGIVVWDSEFSRNVTIGSSGMRITGIKARQYLTQGEVIFKITGTPASRRSRTSFQVSSNSHMEPNIYGAFLNHSCNPNAGVRTSTDSDAALEIVALKTIKQGEDITADYAMFEYETSSMAKVECLCDADSCRKYITGYRDLPTKLRELYHGFVADHLLEET